MFLFMEKPGQANVLQMFQVTEGRKDVAVLGCRCTKGTLKKSLKFKLMRNDEVLHDSHLDSMRHLKSEVDTIKTDLECGLRLHDFKGEAKNGDVVICYAINKKAQETSWDPGF
jgi:translation initiation factor IF-2